MPDIILTEEQKLYPRDAKIYFVADWLIKNEGRTLSWHIRCELKENGITDIKTPQINYFMRKMVAQGKYVSQTLKYGQGVEYRKLRNK